MAKHLRVLSRVMWTSAALVVVLAVLDQALVVAWAADFEYVIWGGDNAYRTTNEVLLSGPGWLLGLWLLLTSDPGYPISHGQVYYYSYPENLAGQLLYTTWPLLLLLLLIGGAIVTKRASSRAATSALTQPRPAPRPDHRRRLSISEVVSSVTALTAIGALAFTGLTLKATHEQMEMTADSQLSTRFAQAVQFLGASGAQGRDLRIGGIYSLGQIGADSPRDVSLVATLLQDFLRSNTPRPSTEGATCPDHTPVDVQVAVEVLIQNENRANAIDPSLTPGVDMTDLCLRSVDFADSSLEYVNFSRSDLSMATFTNSMLRNVTFDDALLSRTNFESSNWDGNSAVNGDFTNARFVDVNEFTADSFTASTDFTGATLTGANFLGASTQTFLMDNVARKPDSGPATMNCSSSVRNYGSQLRRC